MDTELVIRARGGDLDAFATLARPLYGRLQRIAATILGDRTLAEDATQQSMLSVWRNLPRLRFFVAGVPHVRLVREVLPVGDRKHHHADSREDVAISRSGRTGWTPPS